MTKQGEHPPMSLGLRDKPHTEDIAYFENSGLNKAESTGEEGGENYGQNDCLLRTNLY